MNERQQKIEAIISENGEAKLPELERLFPDISAMTLRRDLEKLENLGVIVRTRNGAKSIAHLSRLREEQYSERAGESIAEKNQIAKSAYSLITQKCAVFLDSGTTVACLAKLLTNEKLFIITTAPNIALECVKNPNITVFMTGGQLSSGNLSLSGVNATGFLEHINIDIAFMAASGFSLGNGFTCGHFDECQLKKRVIEKAAKTIMLMDSTKIGKSLPFTFAALSDIDLLVTDSKISREVLEELEKREVEVKWQ